MATKLNPYLNFRDNAKDAMEFYQSVFGGTLGTSTFGEFQVSDDPAEADKIMHALLETPSGLVLMGADVPNRMDLTPGSNFSIALNGAAEDSDEITGYWDKLADGATIVEPLATAPWGDSFGMLTDRFGVAWLVNIAGAKA